MKRLATVLALLLLTMTILAAQQSPPPDLSAGIVAQAAYKGWLEGQVSSLWTQVTGLETSTAHLPADETAITSLQNQLNTQAAQISALQAKVAALAAPPPTLTTLTWTTLADGPLNGLYQGVNFGIGFWCIKSGELSPCADGQPQRSLTFPAAVSITSFTFSTTTATTNGIVLTAQPSGNQLTKLAVGVNQDTTFSPGWTTKITGFTVGATPSTASAPDLRIRQVVFQQ